SMPVPYIAMEYVAGARRLDVHCRAQSLSMRERVALFARVCDAVGHAHNKGVIHRDLKHENVLVNEQGEPKVIDFGIARVLGSDVFRTRITRAGQVLGTFQYMSPEQLAGRHEEVDKRSDVYALGVMLYELVCGRSPREFEGLSPLLAAARVRETAATRPTRVTTEVDADLETIVMAAIDPEPGRRYADAGELGAELGRWLAGEPIVKRPLGTAARGWRRVRMLAGRNRVVAALAAGCVAFAIAAWGATHLSLVCESTERWAALMMSNSTLRAPLGDLSPVVVVTMGDQDNVQSLSAVEAHSDLDISQRGGLRPIMGALTRALTAARAKTIVLDFGIRDNPDVDPALTPPLVDAVRAAVDAGVGVVVGIDRWPSLTVREDVLTELAPYVRWGGFNMGVSDTGPWAADIAHHVAGMDPSPGLALAAYASYLRPDPGESLRIAYAGGNSQLLDIWFSRARDARVPVGVVGERVPRIVITGTIKSPSEDGGPDETTAQLLYEVPDDRVLGRASMSLTEMFTKAADGSLGLDVRGKIVVFADTRSSGGDSSPDRLRPQGVPRVFGHATAIAMLVKHEGPHVPTDTIGSVWTILACVAGAMGALVIGTWGRLLGLAIGLTGAVSLCSVIAYVRTGALVDPLEPVVGLWLGTIGSFLLTRRRG
ncbi:MAG: serine/threonine-protein kinase, partial [Planctomycetota bacterium]